jgi:membrane protein DedA with SNARE-associated domain
MLEQIVEFVRHLDNTYIYVFLFVIAYLENVIPPIPGDLPIAFVGSLIAIDDLSFFWCVVWSSVGCTLGFFSMYSAGRFIGTRLYESNAGGMNNKLASLARKFFPPEHLDDVRANFAKYGYWLIVANRFLAGTRAIISVSAGISHLSLTPVIICAAISAVLWNGLLLAAGYLLGESWETLGNYITTYSLVFTVVILAIVGFFAVRYIRKLRASQHAK